MHPIIRLKKAVKYLVIIALFVVIGTSAFAQSSQTGRVFEYQTRIPIGGVKVENMRTRVITTSDSSGRFTIPALRNDVLIYSAFSYKTDSVAVTNLNYREVFLESNSKQLKDVNINSNNVDINKGASFIPKYVPPSPLGGQTLLYQTDSQGNAVGGLKVMVPGSADKANEARIKEAKLAADEKTTQEIKKKFSASNLKNYVPFEGQEMDNFIILYSPSLKVYRSHDFDFPSYVNDSYKAFMKMPESERKLKTLTNLNAPPAN